MWRLSRNGSPERLERFQQGGQAPSCGLFVGSLHWRQLIAPSASAGLFLRYRMARISPSSQSRAKNVA